MGLMPHEHFAVAHCLLPAIFCDQRKQRCRNAIAISTSQATCRQSHFRSLRAWKAGDKSTSVGLGWLTKAGRNHFFRLAPATEELSQRSHRATLIDSANDDEGGVVRT